jgi:hypothetical protein
MLLQLRASVSAVAGVGVYRGACARWGGVVACERLQGARHTCEKKGQVLPATIKPAVPMHT